MWKKLDSRDPAVNLTMLNYLSREFRAASRLGLLRGDIRIYASSDGFLFNEGAVAQFVILRGNGMSGLASVDAPDDATLKGYTLVLAAGANVPRLRPADDV